MQLVIKDVTEEIGNPNGNQTMNSPQSVHVQSKKGEAMFSATPFRINRLERINPCYPLSSKGTTMGTHGRKGPIDTSLPGKEIKEVVV